MPFFSASSARSISTPARLGSTPGAGLHSTIDVHLIGMAFEEAQHLRAGGRHRDEIVGRLEVEILQHAFEVVHRLVVGELLAHLLGQPGAALVVAHDAIVLGQAGRDRVPAVERAAHLVQQHDDRAALAGELIVNADSVRGGPRQGASSRLPARLANPLPSANPRPTCPGRTAARSAAVLIRDPDYCHSKRPGSRVCSASPSGAARRPGHGACV